MATYELKVPEDNQVISRVRAGDELYVTGDIVIARDRAHGKLLQEGVFVQEIVGLPIFHCGPIFKKEAGRWVIVAGGPTTSIRMDPFIPLIIKKYKTPIIIGKGGLGEVGKKGLQEHGSVYAEFTGGASALAVSKVVGVKNRFFEELGPPEMVWIWEVESFGPLLVTQDHQGNDLRRAVTAQAISKIDGIVKRYLP